MNPPLPSTGHCKLLRITAWLGKLKGPGTILDVGPRRGSVADSDSSSQICKLQSTV